MINYKKNINTKSKFSSFIYGVKKMLGMEILLAKQEQESNSVELNVEVNDNLIAEFDLWLNNKSFEYCAKVHGNGFKITKNQKEDLFQGLRRLLDKDNSKIRDIKVCYRGKIPKELFNYWLCNAFGRNINREKLEKEVCDFDYIIIDGFKEDSSDSIKNFLLNDIKLKKNNYLNKFKMEYEPIGSLSYKDNDDNLCNLLSSILILKLVLKSKYLNMNLDLNNVISIKSELDDVESAIRVLVTKESGRSYLNENLEYSGANKISKEITELNKFLDFKLKKRQDDFFNNTMVLIKDDVIRDIKEKIKMDISNDIDVLPIDIVNKLKSLEKKFYKIKKSNDAYNKEIKSNQSVDEIVSDYDFNGIKKLYEEKLPKILQIYLMIDKDNIDKLLSVEGKNPKELLMESIKHIEDIFDRCIMEKEQEHVTALSVNQRHLKEMNGKM